MAGNKVNAGLEVSSPFSFLLLAPGLWDKSGGGGGGGIGGGSFSGFLWLSAHLSSLHSLSFPSHCPAAPHISTSEVTRVLHAPLHPPPASGSAQSEVNTLTGCPQQAPRIPKLPRGLRGELSSLMSPCWRQTGAFSF